MNSDQTKEEKEEELESEDEEREAKEEEIKNDSIAFYPKESFAHQPPRKKSSKRILIILTLVIAFLSLGFLLKNNIKSPVLGEPTPTPTPTQTPTPVPTPIPNPLIRSEWSFEVLNGTSTSGLAKKLTDQLNGLGYKVVKSGNADKDTYQKSQIFAKAELKDKVDLVIADLKDVIKIASYGGELKDSTASARIIIGKE